MLYQGPCTIRDRDLERKPFSANPRNSVSPRCACTPLTLLSRCGDKWGTFLVCTHSLLCIPRGLHLTVAQGLYQWACLHTAMRRHQSLWHCLLVYRAPILSWVVCGIPLGYGIQGLWIINSDLTYFTVIIRQTHDLRGASGRWNRFDQLVNWVGLYFLFLFPPRSY